MDSGLWGNVILGLGLLAAAIAAVLKWREFGAAETIGDKLTIINQAVMAAEQMLGKEPGTSRLTWVMELLEKRFPEMDADELRMHVEAAVYWLRQGSTQPADSGADVSRGIEFWADRNN